MADREVTLKEVMAKLEDAEETIKSLAHENLLLRQKLARADTENKTDTSYIEIEGSSWQAAVRPRMILYDLLEKENQQLRNKTGNRDTTIAVLEQRLADSQKFIEQTQQENGQIQRLFRMVKYELHAATTDLLGVSLTINNQRDCTVRTAWGMTEKFNDSDEFHFVYDHQSRCYKQMAWSDCLQNYAGLYRYWIQEQQCLAGFLASVFLEKYEKLGPPPSRH